MDAEHLASLRQAATALISTAAAPTVLAALQALLADPVFAAVAPVIPLRPAQAASESAVPRASGLPAPRPAPAKPTAGAKPAAAVASDPAWDELRSSVRQAMAARGLDFAELGRAIGRSGTAIRIDLTSRKPPRPVVQTKLKAWLEQAAPAVAAYPATFPGSSGRRGNGHAVGDGYHSTIT